MEPLPQIICNLTSGGAFAENGGNPHVPILAVFGEGPLHSCRISSTDGWNLKQAIQDRSGALVRSVLEMNHRDNKDSYMGSRFGGWDDLTFQFGSRAFLYVDPFRITSFASTPAEAEKLATEFAAKYRMEPDPVDFFGNFFLLKQESDIGVEEVPLRTNHRMNSQTMLLHYGPQGASRDQSFLDTLRRGEPGIIIFEGPPGTGKTYYLRHLMASLHASHEFYFIPPSEVAVLSHRSFVEFWAKRRKTQGEKTFVIILEDADTAIMSRAADNESRVSTLLNLSDGLLGDFLKLQIICTINCQVADVDQALLRPGRLLCHRVFERLDHRHAAYLAESLGRKLPDGRDYSLAEVFAEHLGEERSQSSIGFAA